MLTAKPISPFQFAFFRIVFGLYLAVHFVELIPYGPEIFGRQGMLPDPALNATHGLFPNLLAVWDSAFAVRAFLMVMAVLSLFFAAGFWRRTAAVALWYGWACLFNRNNLISNPSLAYVGLLLLLTALVPLGEPLVVGRRSRDPRWFFPAGIFWTAWIVLAAGYTYSGAVKLMSPSWLDGSALGHLANNPLARPNVLRDVLLALPPVFTRIATWAALAGEVLFLPLCLTRRTRLVAWTWMGAMHLGILSVVDFLDLTAGMLMVHLFTFDPAWFPARAKGGLILFDGVCGLCDRSVQFLLDEDRVGVLRFAPLQGETAAAVRSRHPELDGKAESLIFVENHGERDERVLRASDGVFKALDAIGGLWRLVSWLRLVPRFLREGVYRVIANNRYAWFGKFDACRAPSPAVKLRFLP